MKYDEQVLDDIIENIDLIAILYQKQLIRLEEDGVLFPRSQNELPIGTLISKFDQLITEKTIALICDYLNTFDVTVDDGVDELKCAFWYGIAIIDTLSNEYHYAVKESMSLILTDIALATLKFEPQRSANYCVKIVKYLNKLTIMYLKNTDKTDMGKYGIYLKFKMINDFIEEMKD